MDILGMFGMLNLLVQVPRVNEYVYSFLPHKGHHRTDPGWFLILKSKVIPGENESVSSD